MLSINLDEEYSEELFYRSLFKQGKLVQEVSWNFEAKCDGVLCHINSHKEIAFLNAKRPSGDTIVLKFDTTPIIIADIFEIEPLNRFAANEVELMAHGNFATCVHWAPQFEVLFRFFDYKLDRLEEDPDDDEHSLSILSQSGRRFTEEQRKFMYDNLLLLLRVAKVLARTKLTLIEFREKVKCIGFLKDKPLQARVLYLIHCRNCTFCWLKPNCRNYCQFGTPCVAVSPDDKKTTVKDANSASFVNASCLTPKKL